MLEVALGYYDQFAEERGNDPTLAREMASTYTRVARLSNTLNSRAKAFEAHEKALALRRKIVAADPSDRRAQAALAETLHDIGILERALGRRNASIVAFNEALRIRQSLAASDPECEAFLRDLPDASPSAEARLLLGDLARSYGYIGDWQRESGLRDEAKKSYGTAKAIRRRLSADDPNDLIAKFQLARSWNNEGIMAREDKKIAQGIAAQEEARKLQAELSAIPEQEADARLNHAFAESGKAPDVEYVDFASDLASTENYLGILNDEGGHQVQAIAHHQAAREIRDRLVQEHPGVPRWDADRALTATYLGELEGSRAELDWGRELLGKLLAEDPKAPRLRAGMARNLVAGGVLEGADGPGRKLVEEGIRAQEQLVAEQPNNYDFRADLEHSRAALKGSKSRPNAAVQRPIPHGLGDVVGLDVVLVLEVGHRPGDPEYLVVGPRR